MGQIFKRTGLGGGAVGAGAVEQFFDRLTVAVRGLGGQPGGVMRGTCGRDPPRGLDPAIGQPATIKCRCAQPQPPGHAGLRPDRVVQRIEPGGKIGGGMLLFGGAQLIGAGKIAGDGANAQHPRQPPGVARHQGVPNTPTSSATASSRPTR